MIIDVIFLIAAAYGFWVGYSRGIIQTVFTVLSFVFGLMAAVKFGPAATEILRGFFPNGGGFLLVAGVILTFVLTMALFRIMANVLEGGLQTININFINQLLGGALSALFFTFVYSVLVMFADRSRLIEEETKAQSFTYALLEPFPQYAWTVGQQVWPVFREFYDYALDLMDDLSDGVEQRESDSFFDIEDDGTNSRYE